MTSSDDATSYPAASSVPLFGIAALFRSFLTYKCPKTGWDRINNLREICSQSVFCTSPVEKFDLEFIADQNFGVFKIAKEFLICAFFICSSPSSLERIFTVPIFISGLSHVPFNKAVWMASCRITLPPLQSIKGFTNFSQLIPSTMSTLCNKLETVKSVFVVTPPSVIGASCTRPRERAFCPFPNSRKVSWGTQDNPPTAQHSGVTKHLVAPLSIKALNSFPLIFAGTTKRIPSSSILSFFIVLSFFSPSPITTPVNLTSSPDVGDFSFSGEILTSSSVFMRPLCRQRCKLLKVVVVLDWLPPLIEFNSVSSRPSTCRNSLRRPRATRSFSRRRVRLLCRLARVELAAFRCDSNSVEVP